MSVPDITNCQLSIFVLFWLPFQQPRGWYHLIVLIFLTTHQANYLFMCFLAIILCSFVRYLLNALSIFNWVVYFLISMNFGSSLYIQYRSLLSDIIYKYFLPVCSLSFTHLNIPIQRQNFPNLDEIQSTSYFMSVFGYCMS
jgi:hypothetical protein